MKRLLLVLITLVLLVSIYFAYTEVDLIHDFFSPYKSVMLRQSHNPEDWQQITFEDSDYLVFDNPFYKKEVVNDGNNNTPIELRVKDIDGTVILEATINNGMSVSLSELQSNKDYIVEVKFSGDAVVLCFA